MNEKKIGAHAMIAQRKIDALLYDFVQYKKTKMGKLTPPIGDE